MNKHERQSRNIRLGVKQTLVILLAVALLLLAGCGGAKTVKKDPDSIPAPASPPPWDLSTPKTAVVSYQYWISYAYRVGNSDVASQTFTPYEEVRVNSYVAYMTSDPKHLIDQKVAGVKVKSIKTKDNTATVSIREDWDYRYISLVTKKWQGPPRKASYDSTYTVVKGKDDLWRVDSVQATPIGAVK